jgi:hypothetical protein
LASALASVSAWAWASALASVLPLEARCKVMPYDAPFSFRRIERQHCARSIL